MAEAMSILQMMSLVGPPGRIFAPAVLLSFRPPGGPHSRIPVEALAVEALAVRASRRRSTRSACRG